ncbi:MAG TPA: sigma-70 family RNA polymerase sigma factor [Pyrinomonadaceae bacterium]|jgi:RNA polymerase sigma factor (TIGR02999 family)|nr:sigma-70 family RNA polymerase sigma factor [Pyrinomonadaceae bacterium]
MSGHAPENITDLLLKWSGGDATALEQLMPLVYDELRRLAVRYLRRERDNHSLQPTALVNEAYLRLVDQQKVEWQSRAQFYGLAARVMRNILVDHARSRQAAKRGGEQFRVSFDGDQQVSVNPEIKFLAVHEALERLTTFDAQKAQIVELRFFGGLSIEETAEVLGIGHATVERDWKLARAWLRLQLE